VLVPSGLPPIGVGLGLGLGLSYHAVTICRQQGETVTDDDGVEAGGAGLRGCLRLVPQPNPNAYKSSGGNDCEGAGCLLWCLRGGP
jgi:hypothetical protein